MNFKVRGSRKNAHFSILAGFLFTRRFLLCTKSREGQTTSHATEQHALVRDALVYEMKPLFLINLCANV